MKAGIFGVGAALPRGGHHQRRLERAPGHERRVDRPAHRDPRAAPAQRHDEPGRARRPGVRRGARRRRALGRRGRPRDRRDDDARPPDAGLAPEVAARLGAEHAGAVDVNAACAGFVYALEQAAALVESGRARVVVVCGAEALSRVTDHEDRSTAILFGDGAGAVVVAGGDLELGLGPFVVRCDGTHADLLYADAGERLLRMEGREVYRHAVARMVEVTREALARAGMEVDELDVFVAHQANARIVKAAAAELGVPPERVARQRRPRRQHLVGLDPAGAVAGRARRAAAPGRARGARRLRRRVRLGRRGRLVEGARPCLRVSRAARW